MSDRVERMDAEEADEAGLEALLAFVRDSRGFDFTGYKRSSLTRRIRKRMHEAGFDNYVDYRDRLESDPEEFGLLFNTILINVTGFFRDAEAWTYLQREVMPELIAETEGVTLVGAVERKGAPEIGADAGVLAGLAANGVIVGDDPLPAFAVADGVLDFTVPAATIAFAELAA